MLLEQKIFIPEWQNNPKLSRQGKISIFIDHQESLKSALC